MKPSERLAIIDRIGRELQSRYTFDEIDIYLGALGIDPPPDGRGSSKWVYSKAALTKADDAAIGRIAEDLGLGGSIAGIVAQANPPAIWQRTTDFRLFISHVAKDKDKAQRLKECLAPYGIRGFVAHDDIEPTKTWQGEIERALQCMHALVAVHTKGFSLSNWTQQEIGFALGRGVKVISFMMGEIPTGFLSARQGLSRQQRPAEDIAKEIAALLESDSLTAGRLKEARAASPQTQLADAVFETLAGRFR